MSQSKSSLEIIAGQDKFGEKPNWGMKGNGWESRSNPR